MFISQSSLPLSGYTFPSDFQNIRYTRYRYNHLVPQNNLQPQLPLLHYRQIFYQIFYQDMKEKIIRGS